MIRSRLAARATEALVSRTRHLETLSAPALVLAPHQDDEVLGCGGTIIAKVDAGARVDVVFLTDGSRSHPQLGRAELRRLRREEAIEAARRMGVESSQVHFLDFEDGALRRDRTAAEGRVSALLDKLRPAQVFAPAAFDHHPDHVAAHAVTRRAIRRTGRAIRSYGYSVYMWTAFPWSRRPFSPDMSRPHWAVDSLVKTTRVFRHMRVHCEIDGTRKLHALAAYRTQMERPPGNDPSWWTLPDWSDGDFIRAATNGLELFALREPRGTP